MYLRALPWLPEPIILRGTYAESFTVFQRSFYLARICFVASLGGLLFGFDTAVISGTFSMVNRSSV
jgi:hypothetical protein